MKICLKVTTPAHRTRLFEHAGPVVRIGRDASCELPLAGEDAGKAASTWHARIDLSPNGALLIDTASTNKTFHNNEQIETPTALKVGDRIQIGYTGSTLDVVDLDLTPSAPRLPGGVSPRLLLAGCGVLACLAILLALFVWPRRSPEVVVGPVTPPVSPASIPIPLVAPVVPVIPVVPVKPVEPPPIPKPIASLPEKLPLTPGDEMKTVGHYLRSVKGRPSVLLQRMGENYPWTVLRSGQAVSTACSLVSLPGYESVVSLEGGLRLNLWGSLPEFASPVLESAVMLNQPAQGMSLDLTLDRGRVEIDNSESPGACRFGFASSARFGTWCCLIGRARSVRSCGRCKPERRPVRRDAVSACSRAAR